MDIDLKTKLDTLLMACKTANLKESVIKDILAFIQYISVKNSGDRCRRFSVMYLGDDKYTDNISADTPVQPQAFKQLCTAGRRVSSLYISFILDLGKYFIRNKYDKKDVDSKKVSEYLRMLNDCAAESPDVKENKAKPQGQQVKKESDDKQVSADKGPSGSDQSADSENEETLDDLFEQLNSLIGMNGVKDEIRSQINMIQFNRLREERGFESIDTSKHMVFLGNPGTGKTTVARLLSKMYKQIGVLETGQLVEVDRGGLVAGYVGQTAERTKEKIDEAMGGILFIDEAYTLAKGGNDFGQEAIDTLLKAMEDNRDKFVVIVAGYPDPMDTFLNSNPGLRSRFNKYINFEDYSEEELYEIFESVCKKQNITLTDQAKDALKQYLIRLVSNKPDDFANGREMRNLFETSLKAHSDRIAAIKGAGNNEDISNELLNELDVEDLQFKEI